MTANIENGPIKNGPIKNGPIVATASGRVRGAIVGGVAVFKGIPYAAAPFGALRFAAPAAYTPWHGLRDALAYGPTPPKPPYPAPLEKLMPETSIPGEDVLNLNVWTPDVAATGLPVMVWLHGGAFTNGSSALPVYDGSAFARDGVVCVGINYRLGVDGFALLDGAPPNRGLLDQIAALRWVHDNIAAFGGDPDQVTLVGESAGAMSAAALMTMPAARGLFRRAVLQSGAGHHARRPDAARKIAESLAGILGVPATAQGLARVPIPDLIAAQARFTVEFAARPDPARWAEDGAASLPFEPCVDGDMLPARPIEAIAAGAGSDVAVLIGSNTDEFRLFTVPFGADQAMTAAGVGAMLAGLGVDAGRAMRVYSETAPGARPGEVFMAAMRDFVFRVPALRLAEARTAHGAGTFVYEFAWPSPCYDGRLGAAHALELAYVFDRLPVVRGTPVYGEHPPQTLADAMHRAWVDFIKTGEPGWPAYGDRRITLRFAEAPELTEDPAASQRTLWDGVR